MASELQAGLAHRVTDTYDYDAFGNLLHSTGTTLNNYLFAGEQFDPDLGLYYNRARYLNTSTGRFWSADPYEGSLDDQSLHRYLYASADPVNRIDPMGTDDLAEAGVASAVSGVINSLATLAFRATIAGVIGGTVAGLRQTIVDGNTGNFSTAFESGFSVGFAFGLVGGLAAYSLVAYYASLGATVFFGAAAAVQSAKDLTEGKFGLFAFDLALAGFAAGGARSQASAGGPPSEFISLATDSGLDPIVDSAPSPSGARTPESVGLSPAYANAIQQVASRTGQTIILVGSRANGSATMFSDFDYILTGNSRARALAARQLPRGPVGVGGTLDYRGIPTGIDTWQSYNADAPNYNPLNPTKPYIIFDPEP